MSDLMGNRLGQTRGTVRWSGSFPACTILRRSVVTEVARHKWVYDQAT